MATPNGARNWPRTAIAVAVALLLVVGSAVIVYRVLAPAEVITPARAGYPAPPAVQPGVVGTLNAAPLIVDDRIRVYASTRTIRADLPVDAPTRRTPYWSYRRWPAQLAGVVADGATVLTRWSDGKLVALDARTGTVRWRATGPEPGHGYLGRRTGAGTVYAPSGLHTARTATGRPVLVVVGTADRRGLDLDTGRELWRLAAGPDCSGDGDGDGSGDGPDDGAAAAEAAAGVGDGLTTADGFFAVADSCAGADEVVFHDVATGALAGRWRPEGSGQPVQLGPVGCLTGRSGCRALRTVAGGVTRGWLLDGARPVPAPALDAPEAVLVDEVAVTLGGTGLVARSARTGADLWRWSDTAGPEAPVDRGQGGPAGGPVRLVAAQPGRVHLRTAGGDLVTLDAATGAERSRFPFTYGRDSTTWAPGFAYAAGGFVAVERLAEPVDPAAGDDRYYLAAQPVILAGT
ncbi:PQQ-binding-like beta-propeller repeat protein [Micromonospora sp. WMMD1102]|uniref:outer membrane protein assembly factor BamB family protein n=1 Tax=Micromonospora sp. WMMD1102 TaxID=3016105 RepID=UPI00241514DB|nr:PQQ-binding-like beta-propeller repeat protein [Micromonospora sp. WMMD1102]MDG4791371.1 PQQ-binding-like beta-propeller repeat protein [Micromonospora sp. WMMD1102]